MSAYNITRVPATVAGGAADLLRVGFGAPAQNDEIVRAVEARFAELGELGGRVVLVNGPASLPVAVDTTSTRSSGLKIRCEQHSSRSPAYPAWTSSWPAATCGSTAGSAPPRERASRVAAIC